MHSNSTDSGSSISDNLPIEARGVGGHVPPPPVAAEGEDTTGNTYPKPIYKTDSDPYPSYVPGVDNLTLIGDEEYLPTVLSYLEQVYQQPFQNIAPRDGYTDAVMLPDGTNIQWGHPRRKRFRLELTGTALRSIHGDILQHLILTLAPMVHHATRVDVAINDMTAYGETPRSLHKRLESDKNSLRYFKTIDGIRPFSIILGDSGDTLYLGRMKSAILARIYDKNGYTRYELQQRKQYGNMAWDELVDAAHESSEAVAQCCADIFFGRVQITQNKYEDKSKNPVARFWSSFQSRVKASPLRLIKQKVQSTIEQKVAWVKRSVAKTLAEVVNYQRHLGHHTFVQGLLQLGQSRMDAHSYAISEPVREAEIECSRTGQLLIKRRIFHNFVTDKDLSPSRVHERVLDYLQLQRRRDNPGYS